MGSANQVRLTRDTIDVEALSREPDNPRAGAIATFVGVVRCETSDAGQPLEALEYTAYEPMALAEMQRLADEIMQRHVLCGIQVVHRLGILKIGEASVAVVVSAPHRAAAFDACRELIERLKVDVPIFKREIWADGTRSWVNDLAAGERP